MAKAHLAPKFVRGMDFFDTELSGFLLEVRNSGGKTCHVRYRDQRGLLKQIKVGNAKILKAEEARKQAQKLLAQISLGGDQPKRRPPSRPSPPSRSSPLTATCLSSRAINADGSLTTATCVTTCCLRSERNTLMRSPSVT